MSLYIATALRQQIREQFQNRCAYCLTAESLTVTTFEIEHIVPVSAGGATISENLCLACPSCNRHKGTRQTAIDPETQTIVSLFHPQQQDWGEHFVWNAEATEIWGRTATGRSTVVALHLNRSQLVRVRKLWVALGEHPPDD